jgi:hypothetical protein
VADIRALRYDGKHLYLGETRIDAIYRRAVTDEIAQKIEAISPFRKAVLDGNICLIGHIKTQIAHNKILFYLIRQDETLSMMTPQEKAFILKHFPCTSKLDSNGYDEDDVLGTKDGWVIKPANLYASQNVSVGKDMTEAQWRQAYADGRKNGYILQSFIQAYESDNCFFDKSGRLTCGKFMNMAGLYVMAAGSAASIRGRACGRRSLRITAAFLSARFLWEVNNGKGYDGNRPDSGRARHKRRDIGSADDRRRRAFLRYRLFCLRANTYEISASDP